MRLHFSFKTKDTKLNLPVFRFNYSVGHFRQMSGFGVAVWARMSKNFSITGLELLSGLQREANTGKYGRSAGSAEVKQCGMLQPGEFPSGFGWC